MDWTSLVVKNLVELVMRLVTLLTTWGAIHSADSVVRLACTRRIPLVVGPSTVVVTLPVIVIVTAREATVFLLLFVCPALHHVASFYYCFGAITPEVTVERLDSNATLEVVDDVVVRDVGDGGSRVEEALGVGSDGFSLLLLAHRQGMSSGYSM